MCVSLPKPGRIFRFSFGCVTRQLRREQPAIKPHHRSFSLELISCPAARTTLVVFSERTRNGCSSQFLPKIRL